MDDGDRDNAADGDDANDGEADMMMVIMMTIMMKRFMMMEGAGAGVSWSHCV